jgi:DNA-binding protein HU-beta
MPAKKPLTKAQIVAALADNFDMSKKDINSFLEGYAEFAYKECKKNGAFLLPGFGKLVLQKRKARMGRNPATGEAIKIPAKTVVKMRLAKACKDSIIPPKKK